MVRKRYEDGKYVFVTYGVYPCVSFMFMFTIYCSSRSHEFVVCDIVKLRAKQN